jgi:transcriptional regulator with XRE-family HTH domain
MGGPGSGPKKSTMLMPNRGAEAIRRYQKRKKLDDATFAEIVGVDTATINRYSRGARVPTIAHAFRIEDVTCGAVAARWWIERPKRPNREA